MNPSNDYSDVAMPATPEELAQAAQALQQATDEPSADIFVPLTWFTAAGTKPIRHNTSGEGALFPFSAARRRAAQRLGFTNSNSSIESAAGWVYLCLTERPAIDAARGKRWIGDKFVDMESAFREKSELWEDAIGVHLGMGNPAAKRLQEIVDEIWLRETASNAVPVIPKGKEAKGAEDPNG